MNKCLTVSAVTAVVASLALTTSVQAGEVLDRVLASKTLTVAAGTDWGPMSFLNDKHELDGYDIDVAKGIAKYLGVEPKFVTPGWDLIAAGKWEGRWDIGMGQMTPTAARAEKFDVSVVYFYEQAVAVVHRDSKATKLADLDGKVIGVAASSSHEAYANQAFTPNWVGAKPVEYQFKAGEVKTYESSNIALDDLRLGDGTRLDGMVTDGTIAENAIKTGYPVKILGTLFSNPGVIALLNGDKDFSEKVAAAVQSMKDDGTLSKRAIKWYGTDHSVEE